MSLTTDISPGDAPTALVLDVVACAHGLDARRLRSLLDRGVALLGLDRTVDEVLLPALRLVGGQWATGAVDVAGEHLVSAASSAWLAAAQAAQPAPVHSQPVLLTCGPRDLHSLGLECLATLLAARGVDTRSLGARTPTASVLAAVQEVRPAAVVVVSHSSTRATAAAVRTVRAVAALGVDVYYAGATFADGDARAGLPGCYLGLRLADAADLVVGRSVAARPGARTGIPTRV